MYGQTITARILLAVGVALLIISLVLGWISFAVPDWLEYNEKVIENGLTNIYPVKFGLWYKCIFSNGSNDFTCSTWNTHIPSFVRVVQVFVPFGLALACLALLSSLIGFASRRAFVTSVLLSGLFAFLSFIFLTIGVTVFATESLVFVERLRLENNDNPRRWAMWLMIPSLVLAFLAAICFLVGSILNWCGYRQMQATGILNHSIDKYADSVFKAPSDSQLLAAVRKQYPEYPNAFYQLNNQQQQQQQQQHQMNPMYYPGVQPSAAAYPGMYPYSRAASPTMNQVYPHANMDGYYPRQYMTEASEYDDYQPRVNRSRRRSPSRSRRSRSRSPQENPKTPQFVPIPVPYYQPQAQPQTATATPSTNPNSGLSFLQSHLKKAFVDENANNPAKMINGVNYNSTQPVYTIAYRPNVLSGAPAGTYVTFGRPSKDEEDEENIYSKRSQVKKIDINETWAWRKL